MQGRPNRTARANEPYQIPAGTPHGLRNVTKPMKRSITYVVEKDKPLATPVPE